jgi:dihydrodipicolinate synthase/N-acetylneuraminate lyase
MIEFEGVSSILPTPFDTDSQVDVQSLRRAIALCIRAGINGLTAMRV